MYSPTELNDFRRVLNALREVVTEAGEEYVYPNSHRFDDLDLPIMCRYVYDGNPDCLAGRVLHKLGVSVVHLSDHERKACDEISNTGITFPALELLGVAQAVQDVGGSWGNALKSVELAYTERNIEI